MYVCIYKHISTPTRGPALPTSAGTRMRAKEGVIIIIVMTIIIIIIIIIIIMIVIITSAPEAGPKEGCQKKNIYKREEPDEQKTPDARKQQE